MGDIRQLRVTPLVCGAGLLAWIALGPLKNASALNSLSDAFFGVLRHGDLYHLLTNLGLIAFAGAKTEWQIGAARTGLLVLICIVAGTLAQYLLVDGRFIGLSAVSYGLLGFAILSGVSPDKYLFTWGMIAVFLAVEVRFQSDTISIYTHITSIFIGGGYAMFGSLFGSKDPVLKPMQLTHIARVVEIIDETDEDDAREAEQSFIHDGLEGLFVLQQRNEVLGVTGFSLDEQVEDIAWLSWTYLTKSHTGEGLGSQMMNNLLGKLKDRNVRKLFIATSDYDDFGKQLYADAHRMYEDFGAEVELTLPGFHGVREAKIVYGLNNPEFGGHGGVHLAENTGIHIKGVGYEAESDCVMGLVWQESPEGLTGMEKSLMRARADHACLATLAIPSDLSDANCEALEAQGFEKTGQLQDYYSLGLHQDWWMCSLTRK